VKSIEWRGGTVRILDQTRLPHEVAFIDAERPEEVADAIRRLAVRGAPLLGIAAAYGMAQAAARSPAKGPKGVLREVVRAARLLVASRPTGVNMEWAADRVVAAATREAVGAAATSAARRTPAEVADAVRRAVLEEALSIAREDEASCEAIGRFGAELVPGTANILTHCNTGALATGGSGTAQGVIVAAHRDGKRLHVWVDETRPLLQGARLTAWELQRFGVPMTLVADTAAGSLMARGAVDLVVVGADRIAANGDAANKVGTYQLAVLAKYHSIPFYVAAPVSTVDMATPTGAQIAIEGRDPDEVTAPFGVAFAPAGTRAANPAFDVTPAKLITAIVTDLGIARPPYRRSFDRLLRSRAAASVDRLASVVVRPAGRPPVRERAG
jgi:methylthioribose-1-phosphate isomerase